MTKPIHAYPRTAIACLLSAGWAFTISEYIALLGGVKFVWVWAVPALACYGIGLFFHLYRVHPRTQYNEVWAKWIYTFPKRTSIGLSPYLGRAAIQAPTALATAQRTYARLSV